jgi:hypothetical protein
VINELEQGRGGGGGGGGFFGGGGGGGLEENSHAAGGGGGSGFGPPGTAFETGVRAGDGMVTITFTSAGPATESVTPVDTVVGTPSFTG